MTMNVEERQRRAGLRPTLLIGLGGTGQKVLVHLKARFKRNYGDVPPAIEFLCFDTDQSAEETKLHDEIIKLTSGTELVNIGGVQTASILRNLKKYEEIAAWITEDKEQIPLGTIMMGAHQVRSLGRLCVFWNASAIYNKIQASIARLTNIRLMTVGEDRPGMNVFIVSSVCGGTGSGALLDIAYMTRKVITTVGQQSDFCTINAVLALPSCFPTVEKVGIEANAFAALTEIDHFMESGEWKVNYGKPGLTEIAFTAQRPFEICYLVDATNENSKSLAGLDEIAPMLAEAIFLQVSSQVGAQNKSVFDNVNALSGKAEDHEEGKQKITAYSSLGTAALVFPADNIIAYCGHRLGHELISSTLLQDVQPAGAAQVDTGSKSFVQSNQMEVKLLLEQLARDSKGQLRKVALDPRQLDAIQDNELLSTTQKYVSRGEDTIDNEFSLMLDTNRKLLADKLATALMNETQRWMDGPTGGLKLALQFLDKLDQILSAERLELDKSRVNAEGQRDRASLQLKQTLQAFVDSFRSNPIGRGGRIKQARDRHVEKFQEYLVAKFEAKKCETAIALLAGLAGAIKVKRSGIEQVISRLQVINNQYNVNVDKASSGKLQSDNVLEQNITSDADVQEYYRSHYERLGQSPSAGLLEAAGPVHAWVDLKPDIISERILAYTSDQFKDLSQITVEQIIAQKGDLVYQRKRLADLINRSVPFWNVRQAGVLGSDWTGFAPIVIVGVEEQEQSIYKDALETNQRLASTFDPHSITVLQTKHGAPLFALGQFPEYRQRQDYVIQKGIKPLYVFPQLRPGGEKAKQVFALGLAYRFIFKSGPYYYVLPTDPTREPVKLEQKMNDALRVFRSKGDLVTQVSNMVDSEISKGIDAARSLLQQFVETPYVPELKGGGSQINIDKSTMTLDLTGNKPDSVNYDSMNQMATIIRNYIKEVLER